MTSTAAKRIRRSAEDSRLRILEAAEDRLVRFGPEGVRVQTIAADLGLTDAAIHHHFGSREGLVRALVERTVGDMKERILAAEREWNGKSVDVSALIRIVGETYGDKGYSKLISWMLLAGWRPGSTGLLRPLAEAIHATRVMRTRKRRLPPPDLEDTLFTVELVSTTLFADALVGSAMRRAVGLPANNATRGAFVDWLSGLIDGHLNRRSERLLSSGTRAEAIAPAGDRNDG